MQSIVDHWVRAHCRIRLDGEENLLTDTGIPRVYVVNHPTTFDLLTLMHISMNNFYVVMDEGAFKFPVVSHFLRKAGFIELKKGESQHAVDRAVECVRHGKPLMYSLKTGDVVLGIDSRPRTGVVRIAAAAKAYICPIFLKIDDSKRIMNSFRGLNGKTYPFTTFTDTDYFVTVCKPLSFDEYGHENMTYEELQEVAYRIDELFTVEDKRINAQLAEEKGATGSKKTKKTGGLDHRLNL